MTLDEILTQLREMEVSPYTGKHVEIEIRTPAGYFEVTLVAWHNGKAVLYCE